MSTKDTSPKDLPPGIYERLYSIELENKLSLLDEDNSPVLRELEEDEAHNAITKYLNRIIRQSFLRLRGDKNKERRKLLVKDLLQVLADQDEQRTAESLYPKSPLQKLIAIQPGEDIYAHPDTPLDTSAVLTGTRSDPPLSSQLKKEIAAADNVDILCSFIRWSGVRLLLDALKELTNKPSKNGPRLRVITTSYMGATEPRAIAELQKLPNTEIQISYDTERTRLHAKAYLIKRSTGFGSAYVGSANISKAALTDGLEWTSKISQYELPHLWDKITASYENYWHDDEFETYTEDSRQKLVEAIGRERVTDNFDIRQMPTFDLRPYPFQKEILDVLDVEREIHRKHQHLVVAATGTGKTMLAAFDYQSWAKDKKPSLLFIAHREEILLQAMSTYRAVLRDHNFGDVLTSGRDPKQTEHLFCSIQSYNSRELWKRPKDEYAYVVVDEFHHAAAKSYQRLLDHVHPKVLLGLTATPERTDGLDILRWFGGETSAEIRLPDAINRRLLCPFQYFGVTDPTDISSVQWQRGKYNIAELERIYTGNDARAGLVLEKLHEIVLDPKQSRCIGFCVTVDHAKFMAKYFERHGIPALALSSESSREERRTARDRLVRRDINIIFVVDLYNEGVDIPQIDTVLFLRPTESLTVYLQQLGRGLRLHDDKECLTVLDFIGAQHQEFRFAPRFRALSTDPTKRVDTEVEHGFPNLPAGCSIQLERVSQQRILENVRQTLNLRRPQMAIEIGVLSRHLKRPPKISEVTSYLDISIDDVLKRGMWSKLLKDAGNNISLEGDDLEQLGKGICRLAHIDAPDQISFLLNHLNSASSIDRLSEDDKRRLRMLHITLWLKAGQTMTLEEADRRLRSNPTAVSDLVEVLTHQRDHTYTRPQPALAQSLGPLTLHAQYTRDEILAGLGYWRMNHRPDFREGVLHIKENQLDIFFITLNKSEDAYSPTTMYDDYVISDELFHWQTQSRTRAESPTGKRYINHKELGYTPILFVRDEKKLPSGLASPYVYLGPAHYVSHEGSQPINIVLATGNRNACQALHPNVTRALRVTSLCIHTKALPQINQAKS